MEVEEIADIEAFAGEWLELFWRVEGVTPFQSPDWLVPWWRHLGEGELVLLAVREQGRLAGMIPLFVYEAEGVRKLLLLGTGTSDYLDGVFKVDRASEAIATAFEYLRTRERDWDVCELHQLRPESPLASQPLAGFEHDELFPGERCPVLALPPNFDDLRNTIPSHQWEKLQYYRRRADREGSVRYERASSDNFDDLCATFIALHTRRLSAQRQSTCAAQPEMQAFLREMGERLVSAGVLRLYVLYVEEKAVAAFFGFKVGRRTYFYLGGFDASFSQLSPGMLVVGHAIERAIEEGCSTFDFLRGQESYKYKWGAIDSLTYTRVLRRPPLARSADAVKVLAGTD
jgi:CelD/BcsL family acetyltransferase involved in cellulose biosynthesis